MAVSLTFNRDFTRFLVLPNFHHSVKVVTATEVLSCSGALLAQHSPVLMDMISQDSELFLDTYSDVGPCLAVLHGQSVSISLENLLDLMKFALQFDIREMYTQCMKWINENLCKENFAAIFAVCCKVQVFTKLFGNAPPENVLEVCSKFLNTTGPAYIAEILQEDEDHTMFNVLDIAALFLQNRLHAELSLPLIVNLITEDNAESMLQLVDAKYENLDCCDPSVVEGLLEKLGECTGGVFSREILELSIKLGICVQSSNSFNSCNITEMIPASKTWFLTAIVNDKLWQNMDISNLINVRKLFNKHVMYAEILLAWIVKNKPSQNALDDLYTQSLKSHELGYDYMAMMGRKLKALGYDEPLPQGIMNSFERSPHFIKDCCTYSGSPWRIKMTIACRLGCDLKESIIEMRHNTCKVTSTKLDASFFSNSSYTNLHCSKNPRFNVKQFFFYGSTNDDKHLQLHTDFPDAYSEWNNGNKGTSLGFIPES